MELVNERVGEAGCKQYILNYCPKSRLMSAIETLRDFRAAAPAIPLPRRVSLACVLIVLAAFLAPGVPFIIDGGIYHDMARAMAERGTLSIGENGGVENAPALTKFLTIAHDGKVMPQYPSGYAFLAAPFYAVFGAHGLMLMNALAFALSIWLSHALAKRFYTDETAAWTAGIFAVATLTPTYALGIWPHMLALAFWLGAVFTAVVAHQSAQRRNGLLLFVLSGFLVGCGLNVRVDVFLAGLIIFFWLQLFARPRDRLAPVLVVLGMAPGLILSAVLNEIKFGAFTPLSYGDDLGLDSGARYIPIAIAASAALIAVWAVNAPALVKAALSKPLRVYALIAALALAGAALAIAPLREFIWRAITGLYVLVINLQAHDAYHQVGVEKNAYGHLLFWGYPKKALIQSLPWMTLLILPCWNAIRGRNTMAAGLSALAIAAPICFNAMNHWHGGGSYSMRYFIPALPFLVMLAANGFCELRKGEPIERQLILASLLLAGALYLGLQELGQAQERFLAPGALYPQWLIAAFLGAAIVGFIFTKKEAARKAAVALSLFAFAYAAAINIYEEIVHERTRAEQRAMAIDASAPIPEGSLVLTPLQTSLIPAEQRGVFVMASAKRFAENNGAAAMAFKAAGRCVYFHNPLAVDVAAPYLTAPVAPETLWAPSPLFGDDPRLAFYTFADAPDRCRAGFRQP